MAELKITIPIKLLAVYAILESLKTIESDRDDYMYLEGFYDCRDVMINVIQGFIDEHSGE